MKERFKALLLATGRMGMERVLGELETLGFFEAPASTGFHLSRPGGLLEHSLNVYEMASMLRGQLVARRPSLEARLPMDSVAIAALLHDVCKAEVYKKAVKRRRRPDGQWEAYEGYEVDYRDLPLGHGEKSVIRLLRWGLDLTDDEMLAIRWHMAPWDLAFQSAEMKGNVNTARGMCPLCGIVQCADLLATQMLED